MMQHGNGGDEAGESAGGLMRAAVDIAIATAALWGITLTCLLVFGGIGFIIGIGLGGLLAVADAKTRAARA